MKAIKEWTVNESKTLSQAGLDLIKEFEGYRLTAYQCPAGVWTIGYGSTKGVKPGMTITHEEAVSRLKADVEEAADHVRRHAHVPLNDNQFAALVSLVFNIGGRAFYSSTLLSKVNAGNFEGASDEFTRWIYVKGVGSSGLLRRRQAERALFLKSTEDGGTP
jgi:lysozyme